MAQFTDPTPTLAQLMGAICAVKGAADMDLAEMAQAAVSNAPPGTPIASMDPEALAEQLQPVFDLDNAAADVTEYADEELLAYRVLIQHEKDKAEGAQAAPGLTGYDPDEFQDILASIDIELAERGMDPPATEG